MIFLRINEYCNMYLMSSLWNFNRDMNNYLEASKVNFLNKKSKEKLRSISAQKWRQSYKTRLAEWASWSNRLYAEFSEFANLPDDIDDVST